MTTDSLFQFSSDPTRGAGEKTFVVRMFRAWRNADVESCNRSHERSGLDLMGELRAEGVAQAEGEVR